MSEVKPMIDVTCVQCGVQFQGYRNIKKYCSDECRIRHRRPLKPPREKVCARCGKAFQTLSGKARFCSGNCKQRFYFPKTVIADRQCDVCGTTYTPLKRHQRYCSTLCYGRGWANNNREHYNSQQRDYMKKRRIDARKDIECPGCGMVFHQNTLHHEYCTPDCHQRHYYRTHPKETKIYQRKAYEKARIVSPWRICMDRAKSDAKRANIPYDLTTQWAKESWTGKCILTDIDFRIGIVKEGECRAFSPSIDRIVPSKGYVQSNCRFILLALNMFKSTWTDADIIRIAKALINKVG